MWVCLQLCDLELWRAASRESVGFARNYGETRIASLPQLLTAQVL